MVSYGYIRVSTEEQAQSGLGLMAQEQAIEAYARFKQLGDPLIFADTGISGGKPLGARPEGRLLVQAASTGDHIVMAKLDRGWRSAVDCLQTIEKWQSQGITLHLIDLGVDLSTPMGKCFVTIASAFAELERGQLRQRTRDALAAAKAKGIHVGQPPFGFRVGSGGRLVPCSWESKTRDLIFALSLGGHTSREIARHLNVIDRKARKKRCWHERTIRKILARTDPPPPVVSPIKIEPRPDPYPEPACRLT